jgi:hypothetical protein
MLVKVILFKNVKPRQGDTVKDTHVLFENFCTLTIIKMAWVRNFRVTLKSVLLKIINYTNKSLVYYVIINL